MEVKKRGKRKTLKEIVQQLSDELDLLHSIIDTVWSELDLDTVLKRIVELVRSYSAADSCLLYLYDKKDNLLRLLAASSDQEIKERVELRIGEGITGWVAANKKLIAIDEKSYSDYRFKQIPFLQEDYFEAFLSVPLIYKGELIGVLNIQRKAKHKHSESEIRLIESIAHQVSGAIVNARLYSELKEKAEMLEALYEASKKLVSENYLDDFLSLLLSLSSQLMNSRFCSLFLYDSTKDKFVLASVQPHYKDVGKLIASKLESKVIREVYETKKPKQILNLEDYEDEVQQKISKALSLKSSLSVPVIDRKKCIGVLSVYTSYPHAFSVEEVRIVQSLANQASAAIRAYLSEERAEKLERKLNERKLVDRAKGILMKKYGFDENQAYEFIRKKSMDLRKTVGEIAESIITASEINSD
ncbi:MAG: GAF domain-containing protein [Actinobacteria bacterium]|nr:GAF domain-containing protein [Actinomycetota bacterium]